ncbi:MAG: hypothetical protein HZB41_13380 [Ignavibacteriae bacterium]|nr:hypothetical protein [Ignavibacteriota bacterium]
MKLNFYNILFLFFGFILNSIVGNANWKKVDIPPGFETNSEYLEVMFLKNNPRLGWICGYEGRVLRTVDGGNTWTGVRIPNGGQLESIHFVDSLNGYTSGQSGIFKSTDGGINWKDVTPQQSSPVLWGNYFVTRDVGVVIGGGCGSGLYFYHTYDGGKTWTTFRQNYNNNGGLTDVVLYSANGFGNAVSSGRLWRTNDGGLSWSMISITGDEDWQEELSINGNTILLPYSSGCGGQDEDGGLRISTDGGINWRQYRTNKPMFGTFLQDEKRGWGVGWERKIYYTSDAGQTWALRNCGIEPGDNLDDIWFINDTTGWVVGYKVYKTFNYDTLNPVITATDTTKCEGDSVILNVKRDYPHYNWSTGETTKSIVVKKSGTYYITVSNTECDSTKSNKIKIYFNPKPKPQIIVSDSIICENDSARLSLDKPYPSIRWSTGETAQSIVVNKEGFYSVNIFDTNGCTGNATLYITVVANPKPEINKISRPVSCVGDSIILETSPSFAEYSWFDAGKSKLISSGKNRIVITEDGDYYVIVKNSYGCIGISDTVPAKFKFDTNRISVDILSSSIRNFTFDSTNVLSILCKKLRIRNVGSETEIIDNIYLQRNIEFSIPQSQFPLTLIPNDSFDVEVCFAPNTLGEQYDTLVIDDHCYPHLIPLLGTGYPNLYGGKTKCDIPIEFITADLYSYTIRVSQPQPNPAAGPVKLDFVRFVPRGESTYETFKLYNTLGSEMATGSLIVREHQSNSNGSITTGNIQFDVQGLTNGLYYALIKTKNNNYIYPVVIDK